MAKVESYAYDPAGKKVKTYIENGKTYTSDGNRIGAGYTVQTGGGIYKMGADGKGVKVDSHNAAPVNTTNTRDNLVKTLSKVNSSVTSKLPTTNPVSMALNVGINAASNVVGNKAPATAAPTSDVKVSGNDYKTTSKSFDEKYAKEIAGIAAANGKDLSVGKAMFTANLNNALMGIKADPYGDGTPYYKGGGSVDNDTWNTMLNDWKTVKNAATESIKDKKTTDSYGKEVLVESLINDKPINTKVGANNNIYTNAATTNNYVDPDNTIATPLVEPLQTTDSISIPIDSNNPALGEVYKDGNKYMATIDGKLVEVSETDYIEFMSRILGF